MTEISFVIPPLAAAATTVAKPIEVEHEIEASIVEICLKYNLPEDRAADALQALVRNTTPTVTKISELPRFAPELYAERRVVKDLHRRETIVEFLRRVWAPWINAKLLTRCALRKLDPGADKAVENYLRRAPLPEDVDIPSFPKRPCKRHHPVDLAAAHAV